jgi:hypothetical protein
MASGLGGAQSESGGLDRLFVRPTWRGTLWIALLALVVSFFALGYWHPYWRNADMDYVVVYQGFLLNDGKPQEFFDHPGHLGILLIEAWYRLLHSVGWLNVAALSDIPKASDVAGFERAWNAAVRAGRLLSLLVALGFVGAFAVLLRRLVADWRIAALATLMLALSTGVMLGARTMRTELLAGGLEILGLLMLLIAARSPGSWSRPLLVGIAALLSTLGMVNKVQAIFLLACWPVVTLFFGLPTEKPARLWREPRLAAVAIVSFAVLIAIVAKPAAALFEVGLLDRGASLVPYGAPPFGVLGLYQAVLAAYVVAAVIAFAWIWRVPLLETVATLEAVALGVLIGLLVIDLDYHPQNARAVFNFLEMLIWAAASDPQLSGGFFSLKLLQSLAAGLYEVFAHATFVLHPSSRATMFLQWVVIAGMVVAWRGGRRQLVSQAAILLAAAWFIDIAGSFRGSKTDYDIFGDSVIVIAAAWLFAGLPEITSHRFAFRIAATLLAAQFLFGQSQPIRATFLLRRSPESTCSWVPAYLKQIERFPYCPPKR